MREIKPTVGDIVDIRLNDTDLDGQVWEVREREDRYFVLVAIEVPK